jgi:hypothetical protein
MYAKVTAHRGFLIFELLVDKSNEEVATNLDRPGNLGQVIMNTKKNVGISDEAMALLKTVKNSYDAIGDVDFFATVDEKNAFSWLGGPREIKDPKSIEGARNTNWDLPYIKIPNEPPAGAIEVIDKNMDSENNSPET